MSIFCLRSTTCKIFRPGRISDCKVHYSKLPRGFKAQQGEKKIGLAGYIFLVFPASTFCLGIWQFNRRSWKKEKMAELDFKVKKSDPVQFSADSDVNEVTEYTKLKVKGCFENSKEIFIGPRSLFDSSGGTGGFGIISSGEKVGWQVITPFQIENGPKILINRGWVPRSRMNPATRQDGQINGPVEIVGILRFTEETSTMTPLNDVKTNQWFSRDVPALAETLDTEQIFLDLDLESSKYSAERGGPLGGQTRISLRNDHVQYMLTWFGLSGSSLYLWAKRFVW